MRTYKVSLAGLGFPAKSAVVVARESIDKGEEWASLAGLPTIKPVSVTLDFDNGDKASKWAKNAAWNIVLDKFQDETDTKGF